MKHRALITFTRTACLAAIRRQERTTGIRYSPGERDELVAVGLAFAWQFYAGSSIENRLQRVKTAARHGRLRMYRQFVQTREPHYRDAMDYVAKTDIETLPAHAGRVRRDSCDATIDELVATLPSELQPFARLRIAGCGIVDIAKRRCVSPRTVNHRLAELRKAINELWQARIRDTDTEAWMQGFLDDYDWTVAMLADLREVDVTQERSVVSDRAPVVAGAIRGEQRALPIVQRQSYNVPLPIMPHCVRLRDGRVLCG